MEAIVSLRPQSRTSIHSCTQLRLTAHTSPSSKPRNMRRGWLGATTMLCCAVAVVIGANNALRLLAVVGRPVVSRRNPPRDVPAPAVRGRVRAVVRTPPLLDGFADCGRSGEGIDNGDRSMLTPLVATGGETDAPTEPEAPQDASPPKWSEPIARALWSAAHRISDPRQLGERLKRRLPAFRDALTHVPVRPGSRRIALTIDDAPSDLLGPVLDALKECKVKATLFVIADFCSTYARRQLLERAVRDGVEVNQAPRRGTFDAYTGT